MEKIRPAILDAQIARCGLRPGVREEEEIAAIVELPRTATVRTTLTNSLGFGGSNATLIFQS